MGCISERFQKWLLFVYAFGKVSSGGGYQAGAAFLTVFRRGYPAGGALLMVFTCISEGF